MSKALRWGLLGTLLLIGGCRFHPSPTPSSSPLEGIPFQALWEAAFPAAWSAWMPQALACGEMVPDPGGCLRGIRPSLTERVVEEAARLKEERGIDAPYVANILGGYAQRPEQTAGVLILAMARSPDGERRARLRSALDAIPERFRRISLSVRTTVVPPSRPRMEDPPPRWARYYLASEWGLLRAAVAAWRPPASQELGCADLLPGEDLCPLLRELRSPEAGPALEARLEEFFRGAFDYADAFARSERALQRDPAAVRAALQEMLRAARETLIPLERQAAERRLTGEEAPLPELETAWDQVERALFESP
jgi:hypothetical protein